MEKKEPFLKSTDTAMIEKSGDQPPQQRLKLLKRLPVEVKFIVVNYILSPCAGVLFCLAEAIGRIKILHFERFPIWEETLIIVSNHPSLLEPVLLPFMGFPWMNFPWIFYPYRSQFKFSLR